MQQLRASSVLKCPTPSAIRHSSFRRRDQSTFGRHNVDSPASALRAPTLRRVATSLAQGQLLVDDESSNGKLQTDDDASMSRIRSHMNGVHEGSNRNGHNDNHNGAAGSRNGSSYSSAQLDTPDAEASHPEGSQVGSKSASSAKDRMQQDLDRERSLNSSSRAEASLESTASTFGTQNVMQSEAASTEGLSDISTSPEAQYCPPRELKRIREQQVGILDEKERLRRMRISTANKGRRPWNLGIKHKPETIAKIRTRTREEMNRPQMIAFLKATHKPNMFSDDVRARISLGVQLSKLRKKGIDTDTMTAEELAKSLLQAKAEADAQKEAVRLHKREVSLQKQLFIKQRKEAEAAALAAKEQQMTEQRKQIVKAKATALKLATAATSKGQGRLRRAAGGVSENSAVTPEQAGELATDERTRQQQLQKALQLVMRLEDALSSFSMNVEQLQASGDTAALERVQEVIDNAQEQLLRAKGQVARLQSGPTPNLSLSKAEAASLSKIMLSQGIPPGLRRFKQALARDRTSRLKTSSDKTVPAVHPVLDV